MNLKILFFCRLAPWVLARIEHMVFASSSFMASLAMTPLTALCGACFRVTVTVIVTVFALIDRAYPRSNRA